MHMVEAGAVTPPSDKSSWRSEIVCLLNGFIQLVVSFTIAVLTSTVALSLLERAGEASTRQLAWWALAVAVLTISVLQYVLALLHMWSLHQSSIFVLVGWESAMVLTCAAQALVMLGALLLALGEAWGGACAWRGARSAGLQGWRAALAADPSPRVPCLLIEFFGKWLVFLGVYWCYSLCVNSYCIKLSRDRIDRYIVNEGLKRCDARVCTQRGSGVNPGYAQVYANHMPQARPLGFHPYNFQIVDDQTAAGYRVPGSIPAPKPIILQQKC